MGLLDDAIREHLELKRRHGADPSEVERQEHEALGPARRSAAPATDTAYAEDDLPAGAVDDEDDPDALYDDDELEYDDEPVASVPVAEPEAKADPAEGEDVLEETPDFLQETPEHERLWFEQKPPRDFDWDK